MRFLTLSFLVSLCMTLNIAAQESASDSSKVEPVESLISTDIESSGGFGAIVFKYGTINDKTGMIFGGRGGWVINRSIVIGGGGYAWLQSTSQSLDDDVDTNLAFAYGGLELEYLIAANKVVHASILTLIGAGGVSFFEGAPNGGYPEKHQSLYSTGVFVFEPAANVEVTVLPWLRVALGVGYRMVTGLDITVGSKIYDGSSLSGVFGVGTIKFGPY